MFKNNAIALPVAAFILLAIAGVIATPFVAVDRDGATKLLEAQGYKHIAITGYEWFACGEDKENFYATGFSAEGPAGGRVRGVVCKGLFFKGATVRFLAP